MDKVYDAIDSMVNEAATMLAQDMVINMRTVNYWAQKLRTAACRCEFNQQLPRRWWQRFFK